MKLKIQELRDVKIKDVEVCFTEDYKDIDRIKYFEASPWPLITEFATNKITVALLQAWHHTPEFDIAEYHEDAEIFYFYEGTALMYFIDIDENDKPLMDTAQLVRIPAGTVVSVAARKGHYVGVAEGDMYSAMVVAPRQGDILMDLPESICGVE